MLRHGVVEATKGDGTSSSITSFDYCAPSLCVLGYSNGIISFYYINTVKHLRHRLKTECILKIAPERDADSSLRSPVTCLRISPCMCFLGVGTANGTITVLDLRTNGEHYDSRVNKGMSFKLLYTHKEHRGRAITALRWSLHISSYKLFSGCVHGHVIELSVTRVLRRDEEDSGRDPHGRPVPPLSSLAGSLLQRLTSSESNDDDKVLSLVYQCQYPVKQIECSLVESSRSAGTMDAIVVTAGQVGEGQEALLFHFPWDTRYRPGCKVLYTTSHHDATQGGPRQARGGCGYLFLSAASDRGNSNSSSYGNGTSGRGTQEERDIATGILAVFGSRPGSLLVEAQLYDTDGNSNSSLSLEPAQATRGGIESGGAMKSWRCRQIVSLYKHVALAMSEDNRIFVLHLQQGLYCELDPMSPAQGGFFAMCTSDGDGICATLSRHDSPRFIALSLYQSPAPTVMTLPLTMRGSEVIAGLARFQRCWRDRRARSSPRFAGQISMSGRSSSPLPSGPSETQEALDASGSVRAGGDGDSSPRLTQVEHPWPMPLHGEKRLVTLLHQAHINRRHSEESSAMLAQLGTIEAEIEQAMSRAVVEHDGEQETWASKMAAIGADSKDKDKEARGDKEGVLFGATDNKKGTSTCDKGKLASVEKKEDELYPEIGELSRHELLQLLAHQSGGGTQSSWVQEVGLALEGREEEKGAYSRCKPTTQPQTQTDAPSTGDLCDSAEELIAITSAVALKYTSDTSDKESASLGWRDETMQQQGRHERPGSLSPRACRLRLSEAPITPEDALVGKVRERYRQSAFSLTKKAKISFDIFTSASASLQSLYRVGGDAEGVDKVVNSVTAASCGATIVRASELISTEKELLFHNTVPAVSPPGIHPFYDTSRYMIYVSSTTSHSSMERKARNGGKESCSLVDDHSKTSAWIESWYEASLTNGTACATEMMQVNDEHRREDGVGDSVCVNAGAMPGGRNIHAAAFFSETSGGQCGSLVGLSVRGRLRRRRRQRAKAPDLPHLPSRVSISRLPDDIINTPALAGVLSALSSVNQGLLPPAESACYVAPPNTYTVPVALAANQELGLNLTYDSTQQCVAVLGFHTNENGQGGPVQNTGLVQAGDRLTGVWLHPSVWEEEYVELRATSLEDTAKILSLVDHMGATLVFEFGETAREEQEGGGGEDEEEGASVFTEAASICEDIFVAVSTDEESDTSEGEEEEEEEEEEAVPAAPCESSSTRTPLSAHGGLGPSHQQTDEPLFSICPFTLLPVPPAMAPMSAVDPSLPTQEWSSHTTHVRESRAAHVARGSALPTQEPRASRAHKTHHSRLLPDQYPSGNQRLHRTHEQDEGNEVTFLRTMEEVFPLSEAYHNLRGGVQPLLHAGKALHRQFREDFPELHHDAESRIDEAYHAAGAGLGIAGGFAVGATTTLMDRLALQGERFDFDSRPDPVVLQGDGLAEMSKDVVSAAKDVVTAAWNTPFLQAPPTLTTPVLPASCDRKTPHALDMEAGGRSPALHLTPARGREGQEIQSFSAPHALVHIASPRTLEYLVHRTEQGWPPPFPALARTDPVCTGPLQDTRLAGRARTGSSGHPYPFLEARSCFEHTMKEDKTLHALAEVAWGARARSKGLQAGDKGFGAPPAMAPFELIRSDWASLGELRFFEQRDGGKYHFGHRLASISSRRRALGVLITKSAPLSLEDKRFSPTRKRLSRRRVKLAAQQARELVMALSRAEDSTTVGLGSIEEGQDMVSIDNEGMAEGGKEGQECGPLLLFNTPDQIRRHLHRPYPNLEKARKRISMDMDKDCPSSAPPRTSLPPGVTVTPIVPQETESAHRANAVETLHILSLPAWARQSVRVDRAMERGLIAAKKERESGEDKKRDASVASNTSGPLEVILDTEALLDALVKGARRNLRQNRRDYQPVTATTSAGDTSGTPGGPGYEVFDPLPEPVDLDASLHPHLPCKELTFQMASLLGHRTATCGSAFPLETDHRVRYLLSAWCSLFTPLPMVSQARLQPKALLTQGQWASLGFASSAEMRDYLACVVDLATLAFFTANFSLDGCQQQREQLGGPLQHVSSGGVRGRYQFCALPLELNFAQGLCYRHKQRPKTPPLWTSAAAISFLHRYAAYVHIDLVAAAAGLYGHSDIVLACTALYQESEQSIAYRTALLDACQPGSTVDACYRVLACPPYSLMQAPHAPGGGFCLVASTLGMLCKANPGIAARLWANTWPALSFNDIENALFGPAGGDSAAYGASPVSLSWQKRAYAVYLEYLEALLLANEERNGDCMNVVFYLDQGVLHRMEQGLVQSESSSDEEERIIRRLVGICRRLLFEASPKTHIVSLLTAIVERALRRASSSDVTRTGPKESTSILAGALRLWWVAVVKTNKGVREEELLASLQALVGRVHATIPGLEQKAICDNTGFALVRALGSKMARKVIAGTPVVRDNMSLSFYANIAVK